MTALRRAARGLALKVPPIRRLRDALVEMAAQQQALGCALTEERAAHMAEQQAHNATRAQLAALQAELVTEREARLVAETRALSPEEHETFARWRYLKSTNRLLAFHDFGIRPAVRFGYGKPVHQGMQALLERGIDRYRNTLESWLPLLPNVATIPSLAVEDGGEPNWINPAFPALDAIALYGLIATGRPSSFIEIGSGFSTKFARRAIRDCGLSTRIVSIDPEPRAEVDAICDEVIRTTLEEASFGTFAKVTSDDLIFFDGSHRTFQNSDVTVFFTEILPKLPAGVLVGIHDIFWPMDYPPAWLDWYFSEQYMLACWLLGGDRLEVEMPVNFVTNTPALMQVMKPFWTLPTLEGASHEGGAFFFRRR